MARLLKHSATVARLPPSGRASRRSQQLRAGAGTVGLRFPGCAGAGRGRASRQAAPVPNDTTRERGGGSERDGRRPSLSLAERLGEPFNVGGTWPRWWPTPSLLPSAPPLAGPRQTALPVSGFLFPATWLMTRAVGEASGTGRSSAPQTVVL